ncbi:MAG: lipoyl(octanoyl) transferase LipB [Bdellovibrionota bacterium]
MAEALLRKDLGLLSYEECWRQQLELLEARALDQITDTLLFVQHPSVITLGRKTPGVRDGAALPAEIAGVPVHIVERGGEATYHGPGQLVVYPIVRLNIKFGPKAFLRAMEEAMIDTLAALGLRAFWTEGKTGVWLLDSQNRERKIASLGIAVRKGVSYHGLALNVSNDLRPFTLIQPCGYNPTVMTSLSEQLGREVAVSEVADLLEAALRARLPLGAVAPEAGAL